MTIFKYPHTFTFYAPSTTKSVYVYGSWDEYNYGYALAVYNNTATWNGTIKFPMTTVKPDGTFDQTYWYYYEIDGTEGHDKAKPCIQEEPMTGRFLNWFTISGNTWNSKLLEAYPTKGRPLPLSDIQSPIPTKPAGSGTLESAALTKELIINAPYSPNSTKSTASSSPFKGHMESGQGSLVGPLEKLGLDTASPSSDSFTNSHGGITRSGRRITLEGDDKRYGGYWSCSDLEEESAGT